MCKTWFLLAHRLGYTREDFGYHLTLEEAKKRYRYLATLFAIDASLIPVFKLRHRDHFLAHSRYFREQEKIKQDIIIRENIIQNNLERLLYESDLANQNIEYNSKLLKESSKKELIAKENLLEKALQYKEFKLPGYKNILLILGFSKFSLTYLNDIRSIDLTNEFRRKVDIHIYYIDDLDYEIKELNANSLEIKII